MNITKQELEQIIEHSMLKAFFDIDADPQSLIAKAKIDAYKILNGNLQPKRYMNELSKMIEQECQTQPKPSILKDFFTELNKQ